MHILAYTFEGSVVRDTDFSIFKTEMALREWRRRLLAQHREDHPTVSTADSLNAVNSLTVPIKKAMEKAVSARKMKMSPRNLDLVVAVVDKAKTLPDMLYDFGGLTVEQVGQSLDRFEHAQQMTAFEFDAYTIIGDEECDRQGIETLHDMFGTKWAEAFYKRKNLLIAQRNVANLRAEAEAIAERLAEAEKAVARYSR